jgi:hypothetical protein
MSEQRKKPGVSFWTTVILVVVLVAYPLSFGPACWYANGNAEAMPWFKRFYWPIGLAAVNAPASLNRLIRKYALYGCPNGGMNSMPISASGDAICP